ncbi:MAG: prephenate dehydrogenase/arogenate dehydrogenase family protein [Acidimicrobiia bacterium]
MAIVGTGLIGGSLGLALRATGVKVVGYDADADRLRRAVERGAVDSAASSLAAACEGVDAVFVAVPVSAVAEAVAVALAAGVAAVSDVGSVKGPVVEAVEGSCGAAAARFVGGHPMAGAGGRGVPGDAVTDGIEGAADDLFQGATWVLTPTERTEPAAFAVVRDLVASVGPEVVAIEPRLHDDLVATVSHLPHLAAATVMHVAADANPNHDTLLRLAAGGFRALTRLSGRAPDIWPDIFVENRDAIVAVLDRYLEVLGQARELVSEGERPALLDFFVRAQEGSSLPARSGVTGPLVELAIPVPDRPGVLAEVTTLAGHSGVNIVDLEITHSALGGTLIMVVPADGADAIVDGLLRLKYRVVRKELG